MANSTVFSKPAKPRPDFPLFPHATGRWAKKVRGKLVYFGKTDGDPKGSAALLVWLDQKDDLLAGRKPRSKTENGHTIRDLCNRFLTVKESLADSGEIARRTFADYFDTAALVVREFGATRLIEDIRPDDFEALRAKLSKRLGANSLGNEVSRIRVLFKYAYDAMLIEKPIRFGPTFKRPAKRILRALKQKKGPQMFAADDLRKIIDAADPQMRAMVLLGINCGFGNHDCGKLPLTALDLDKGWVNFPRPKTSVERRCPLWPETVEALRIAIAERPSPKDAEHGNLVFLTKYGQPWFRDSKASPLSAEFRKLLQSIDQAARTEATGKGDKLPTPVYQKGLGYYTARHCHETIGGETGDQVAVNATMGHADGSMASTYRESISDQRLLRVTNHIRNWLFPATSESV